jgi:HEAT repeat protein
MRHVFVSYCHEDADFAHILEEKIRKHEFTAWRDQALSAGEDWRAEIDAGIREALAAIVILSPASIRSAYVNYEWAFARGSGIPVIPILLEAVHSHLDPHLKALKCLDFTNCAAHPWELLIESLHDLRDALRPTTVQVPRGTPPVLKQAVRELDSMEEDRRRHAIASLAQMDHPAIAEVFAEAARHPIQQVRIGAALQLAARRDARAIPGLLEGLRTRSFEGWMLGKLGEKIGEAAVPALIEAIREEDPYVRERVYWTLGIIGGPKAIAVLIEHVSDPDADNRSHTAFALAGHPAAIPALLKLMHDPESRVRSEAVTALTKCAAKTGGYGQVFPALLEALDDEYDQVAIAACEGLEQVGDPRAIPHLLKAILTNPSEQARRFAKKALRAIGAAPAPTLRKAVLNAEAAVRARAIGLLAEMHEESDVALFISATRDPDREVRKSAADALGGKHANSAVPALLELLQDDDREVAWEAVLSLGRIGDPTAVPALIECLDDGWWKIARAAIIALEEIGDPRAVPALIECLKNDDDDDYDNAELAASALEKSGTREGRAATKAWRRQKAK